MAPSGRVPNTWHFDVRYVAMEPPSHIMLLCQPESSYLHMERLPYGLGTRTSGIEFFPETAEQAAPVVVQAILQSFIKNLDAHTMGHDPNARPATAPWKLMTEEPALARAVGEEMRRLGVRGAELLSVSVSSKKIVDGAQEAFEGLFRMICPSEMVRTPHGIVFSAHKPRAYPPKDDDEPASAVLNYMQTRMNAKPPLTAEPPPATEMIAKWGEVNEFLEKNSASAVKTKADAGDPEASLDYALRNLNGYKCKPDRAVVYEYLVKTIKAPRATAELKSTAHALLIDWHAGGRGDSLPIRYMLAACHHAEHALEYAKGISPRGHNASGAVLWFLMYKFKENAEKLVIPELLLHFKGCWAAVQARLAYLNKRDAKMDLKRMQQPNRYRCAAPGCGIMADKGKMLQRCSGKCDTDKKPAYCSKACQLADWKNHRPFCKPGMPCSVIDDYSDGGAGVSESKDGAIGIRVPTGEGSRERLIMSSTMSAEELKELREQALKDAQENGRPSRLGDKFTVDIGRLE